MPVYLVDLGRKLNLLLRRHSFVVGEPEQIFLHFRVLTVLQEKFVESIGLLNHFLDLACSGIGITDLVLVVLQHLASLLFFLLRHALSPCKVFCDLPLLQKRGNVQDIIVFSANLQHRV